MERNHLERLLKANELSLDACDEDIKAMLIGASYTDEEVARAIATLRAPRASDQAPLDTESGNKKLFRSGERLDAGEISQLLGVNMVVKEVIITEPNKPRFTFSQLMTVWLVSAAVAAILMLGYMYTYKVGMFHPAMAQVYDQ